MELKSKLIKKTQKGELYKIYNLDDTKIYFKLTNVKLLYDIQKYNNVYYLKWDISNSIDKDDIQILEKTIKKHFNADTLYSCVKNKYAGAIELTSKLQISKDYFDIIGNIETLENYLIVKDYYDIILYPYNVYIENSIIRYTLHFKKIYNKNLL
tara:strand:+ start:7127 stop:7588 length:462 start_codon:yes stop_codon:yes gene_type:complete